MDTELTPAGSEPAPEMPLASRLANVFAAPGEVFDAIRTRPVSTANWLVPALLIIVLGWLSAAVIFNQDSVRQQLSEMTEKGLEKQIASGKLTQEQADKARDVSAVIFKISAVAVPVLTAIVVPFWWGLLLWLAGAKAMHGGFSYMKAVELAGLANIILVLDTIVRTLLIVVTGNLFAGPGLVLLVKDYDPQNAVHGLLAMANATLLWILILRSIGLARFCRVTFVKAAVWVFGMWATFTALLFGFGQFMKMLGKAAGGG